MHETAFHQATHVEAWVQHCSRPAGVGGIGVRTDGLEPENLEFGALRRW